MFSDVFGAPLEANKLKRAPENATQLKAQIRGTVDCLRFRVRCVFGCVLFRRSLGGSLLKRGYNNSLHVPLAVPTPAPASPP